jgi:hypothetical protein
MPYGIQQLLDAVARAIASVAGTRNGRAALAVPQGRNSRN